MTLTAGPTVTLRGVADWDALGVRWRELEARADGSFFQSWSWIGCLAPERYDDPVLLEAHQDGRTAALALFNRRRGWLFDTLWLHQTGDAGRDAIFIEYNGVSIAAEADAIDALRAACLAEARHGALPGARFGRRLILGGVDPAHLRAAAAAGAVFGLITRLAPTLDLAALRQAGRDPIDVLSANSRAQLRRSMRAYATVGALGIRRAADIAEAHRILDLLAKLHQATWRRRGRPGAFANPHFSRFHHALIDLAWPRGEIDLWLVTAGAAEIGCLYNFQHHGRVLAYQSGFDYELADRRAKPGLTCHYLAIAEGLAEGRDCYDFLAGDDRYKRSLADGAATLHWLTVGPRIDPTRLVRRARGMMEAALPYRVEN